MLHVDAANPMGAAEWLGALYAACLFDIISRHKTNGVGSTVAILVVPSTSMVVAQAHTSNSMVVVQARTTNSTAVCNGWIPAGQMHS